MLRRMRMHDDQIELTPADVAAAVGAQFPCWADLPVEPVASHGTVNLLFRLGADLVVRVPMQQVDPELAWSRLQAEADSARWLSGRLPVSTPEPVTLGRADESCPLPWAVYRWLPGTVASGSTAGRSTAFARDLAGLVRALWALDTEGRRFSGSGRGGRLSDQDAWVDECLRRSHGLVDVAALEVLWARLRLTPRAEPDAWSHGDLMPGNLLVEADRLRGVIDVGSLRPADPALDLMPAWNLLEPSARDAFRHALGVEDDRWARGQGWALAQAIGCVWYYRETNPVMSRTARRTLAALLDSTTAT